MKSPVLIIIMCFSTTLLADRNQTLPPEVQPIVALRSTPVLEEPFARNGPYQHKPVLADEITGIVIDESFTNLARDFSQGFSQIWRNQPTNLKYSVTLKESNSALRGNRVTISFKRQVLYIANLNRRKDNVKHGRDAARSVIRRLHAFNRHSKRDPDLAEDEF